MKNFCHYIEQHAQKSPKKTFLANNSENITWNQFYKQLQKYIYYFSKYNIRKSTKILLMIDDRNEFLYTFFSIIHLGGLPILLNFHDSFHVKKVLTQQNYEFICCDKAYELDHINAQIENSKIIFIDEIKNNTEHNLKDIPSVEGELMFALYTSGTYGNPKYVVKSNENIMEELLFLKTLLKANKEDIFLTIVPYIHIYGLLFGVLLPIYSGSVIAQSSKFLLSHVIKTIARLKITYLVASPVHYASFIKMNSFDITPLKLAISSGAPLEIEAGTKFCQKTRIPIMELYGSTETGGIAYKHWQQDIPNLRLFPYIKMQTVNTESMEELQIQSPCISTNVFEGEWYNTGDYISWNKDDTFTLVGRQQQIIKFAGKRIATAQLEEELKFIDDVNDVAVVRICENSIRGERAVAFIDCKTTSNIEKIKKQFGEISANANIFSKFFIQKPIPRNHNNKVDYHILTIMAETRIKSRELAIGVIIPTYNHANLIEPVIRKCLLYIENIIVVIDGSSDDTYEKIKDFPIEIEISNNNHGKGYSLKKGFQKAQQLKWQYAITIDSDGQHFPWHLIDFIRAMENNPGSIVVGNRDMSDDRIPSSSKFGKNFTNFWLKLETGVNVGDGQSGFRLYPVDKINQVKTYFSRYEFEVEILARSLWHGIPVISIPISVEYNPPGGRVSHFRPFMDNLRTSILNTILVTIRVLNLLMLVRFKKL